MKHSIALASLLLTTIIGYSFPSHAQTAAINKQARTACMATTPAEQIALNAAKNEARQAAEAANGGLSVYRAEPAMHGAAIASPCELLSSQTWRFTIRGGNPTAVALSQRYTTLSIVTVKGTGRDRTVTVEYNGPIDRYNR